MNFIGSPKQAFEMLNFPIKKWKPCFSGTCQKVEDWLWLFSRSYINHHHHHIFAIILTESKLKYILLTRDMWRTRGQLTNPKGTWMCRVLNYCYGTAYIERYWLFAGFLLWDRQDRESSNVVWATNKNNLPTAAFLVADTQLYERLCPSDGPSVTLELSRSGWKREKCLFMMLQLELFVCNDIVTPRPLFSKCSWSGGGGNEDTSIEYCHIEIAIDERLSIWFWYCCGCFCCCFRCCCWFHCCRMGDRRRRSGT